jgi:Glycosyltransferase family 87
VNRLERLVAAALPIVAVVVFATFLGAALWASNAAGTLGFDFLSYDTAVRRFLAGGVLYDQSFDLMGPFGAFYYPPIFVLVMLPFAVLDVAIGTWAFIGLLALAFVGSIALFPVPARIKWLLLLLGGLSWPVIFAIKLGSAGPLVLLCFAVAWRWLDRPWPFGAAAAMGAGIKLQPAILLGWALLTGRRRAVAAGLVALLVLALAATAVTGPTAWLDQMRLLAHLSQPLTTPGNITPGRMAIVAGLDSTVAWAFQVGNLVLVALVVLYAVWRATSIASFMAAVVASQMLAPILWGHYAIMLFLPVAWLLARGRRWPILVVLATSVPAIAFGDLGLGSSLIYLGSFWLMLLAVVWEGRTTLRPGAGEVA